MQDSLLKKRKGAKRHDVKKNEKNVDVRAMSDIFHWAQCSNFVCHAVGGTGAT